jgi:hypothetical protein
LTTLAKVPVRHPGSFGVGRSSRAVSLDDDRNPESELDQELLSLISDQRGDESDEPYFGWAQPGVDKMLGGLGRMFEYADAPGRELLREPLSTAMTYHSLNEARGKVFDPDTWWEQMIGVDIQNMTNWDQWKEAHEIAQDRSVGQSVALGVLSSGEEGNRVTDPEFLMRHQEGMERDPEGGWQEIPDNDSRWMATDPQAAYKAMSAGTDAGFRIFADPINAAARVVMRGLHLLTAGRTASALDRGVASGKLLDPERFVSFEGVDGAKLVDDMRSARAAPDVLQQQADVVVDGVMNPVTAGENTLWTRDLVVGEATQMPSAMPPRRGAPTSGTDAAIQGSIEDLGFLMGRGGAGTGNPTSALNHFLHEGGATTLRNAEEIDTVLGMVRNDLQEIVVKAADDLGMGDEISVLRAQIVGAEVGPSVSTRPIQGASVKHTPLHPIGGPQSAGRDLDIIEAVVNPRTDILASMDLRTGGYGHLGEAEALIDPAVLAAKTRFQGSSRAYSPRSGLDVPTGGMYDAVYGPGIHDIPAFGDAQGMFIRMWLNRQAANAAPLSPEWGKVIPGLKTADQILGVPGAAALETAMLDSARRSRERRGPQ